MTIYFPDVSNHNAGLVIQPNTVAVVAKATQGNWFTDSQYQNFRQQAGAVGAIFQAYHFLEAGNAASQAQFCFNVVGPGVSLMLDFEPTSGSSPSIADAMAFRDAYRSLGGNIRSVYLPKWYWQGTLGSAPLTGLADLALVSSDYVPYSDSGPGWDPYGGLTPAIWQYTDSQPYGGQSVDFNAFKGSASDLLSLFYPGAPLPPQEDEEDMPQQIESLAVKADGQYVYPFPKGKYIEVAFVADDFGGASASLRVVFWTPSGPSVHSGVSVPSGSTVLAFDNAAQTYAVTVTREDSGSHPVGVAFA